MKSSNNTEKTLDAQNGKLNNLYGKHLQGDIEFAEQMTFNNYAMMSNSEFRIESLKKKHKRFSKLGPRYHIVTTDIEVDIEEEQERLDRYTEKFNKYHKKMRAAYMALTEKQLSHAKQ